MELSDLLEFYPSSSDKDIQKKITLKREFLELASQSSEKLEKYDGGMLYYKHQLLVQRLADVYDYLFLFHDTGTGKSRLLGLIGEHFRQKYEAYVKRQSFGSKTSPNFETDQQMEVPSVRKVLVLVRNNFLKVELEKQILENSQGQDYEFLRENSRYLSKRMIRSKINEWYQIVGFQSFARRLEYMDDDVIRERYKNRLIFFDECHKIRIDPTIGKPPETSKKYNKWKVYYQIKRLFHLSKGSKLVLASGTPMINNVSEIGALFNLFPDVKFPKNFPYETASLEDYEPYFRGKISYVRNLDTGININNVGIPVTQIPNYSPIGGQYIIEDPKIKVFPTPMSSFQNEVYMKVVNKRGVPNIKPSKKGCYDLKKTIKKTFYHDERQISNFVYPNGKWGTEGFNNYTYQVGSVYYPTSEFKEKIKTIEDIRTYGGVMANIIEFTENNHMANTYIYDNFVKASGIFTLAICFNVLGYEIFNDGSSVFQYDNNHNKVLKADFKKKKRVALVTGFTGEDTLQSILELFNSYENRHGEYIKAFLASPTANEGFNLMNVTSIHLVSCDWTYPMMHQAERRAIRNTSQELSLREKQEEYRNLGLDPADARVNVNIYHHVAVSIPTEDRGKVFSIGADLYTLAEAKDRSIRRVQRFMKQCSIDGQIHYQRNVRSTDIMESIENDYADQPIYKLNIDPNINVIDENIDYTTYDIHYTKDHRYPIHYLLKTIFQKRVWIHLKDLYEQLGELKHISEFKMFIPRKYAFLTILDELITSQAIFRTYFGTKGFLKLEGDLLYLSPNLNNDITNAYYMQHIYSVQHKPLKLWIQEKQKEKIQQQCVDESDLEQIINENTQDPVEWWKEVHSVPLAIQYFEYAFIQYVKYCNKDKDKLSKRARFIIEMFEEHNEICDRKPSMFYMLRYPKTGIDKLKHTILNREYGRGRKPKFGIRKVRYIHYDSSIHNDDYWDEDTHYVYVHTLYNLQESKVGYSDKTRFFKAQGKLRILDLKNSSEWRDATDIESVIISLWIQKELQTFRSYFEDKSLVYGYYLNDKKSLIVRNKINETLEAQKDKRKLNSGRVCINISASASIKILHYLDIEAPALKDCNIISQNNKKEIIQRIIQVKGFHQLEDELQTYDKEYLMYIMKWLQCNKRHRCKAIEKKLKEKDLIFHI